jgi:membrane-associated phospholipid phosphatase
MSMKYILITFLCLICFSVNAQQANDTTKKNIGDTIKKDLLTAPDTVRHLHSKPWAYITPAILITYGASSFFIHPVRQFDHYVHDAVEEHVSSFHSKAENYFQFAPVAIVYGLNLVGVEGKNRFVDRTALLFMSAGIMGASTSITKHTTHRLRPNGGDYLSFPSGHTANAFMGAEFLAQEFSGKSPWYGIVGYTIAASTGIFRIGNRDHWFSDTVAGAGYGILSTKAAYLIYPYIRNFLTHTGKTGKSAMIMPTYQDGTAGLYLTMSL